MARRKPKDILLHDMNEQERMKLLNDWRYYVMTMIGMKPEDSMLRLREQLATVGYVMEIELNEKEKSVLYARIHDHKKLREAGDAVNVGQERARQIENLALSKLRHNPIIQSGSVIKWANARVNPRVL